MRQTIFFCEFLWPWKVAECQTKRTGSCGKKNGEKMEMFFWLRSVVKWFIVFFYITLTEHTPINVFFFLQNKSLFEIHLSHERFLIVFEKISSRCSFSACISCWSLNLDLTVIWVNNLCTLIKLRLVAWIAIGLVKLIFFFFFLRKRKWEVVESSGMFSVVFGNFLPPKNE